MINCERRIYSNKIDVHDHGYAQFIIPVKGELLIKTDHKNLTIDDKKLFLVPPECTHKFAANSSNEFLVMDISKEILGDKNQKKMQGGRLLEFDDKWRAIRYLLMQEVDKSNNNIGITHLFNYFSGLIIDEYKNESIKYIENNYHDDISLAKLAKIENYSEGYYSEWFKRNMNKTVKRYIKEVRIQEAKKLLADTNYSMIQVANMVGYKYHSSLTRVFKEVENITPNEFKKRI